MFFCVFGGGGRGSAAPAISGATRDDLVEKMVRVWARGRRGELARECEGEGARHRGMTANFKFKIAAQECGQRRMNAAVRGYEQRHWTGNTCLHCSSMGAAL